jgi:hypothetical protein
MTLNVVEAKRPKRYRVSLIAGNKNWVTEERPKVREEPGILVFEDTELKADVHVPQSAVWWYQES